VSSAVLLRARVLSHGGRQLIAQDSGCHSNAHCSSEVCARLLRARCPARIARRVAGKESEELLLEARVQRASSVRSQQCLQRPSANCVLSL
jgi:hypothetical protein